LTLQAEFSEYPKRDVLLESMEEVMESIFISYARDDDEPFVKQLRHDLQKNGFDVWWDRESMDSRGLTFLQEIRDGIGNSDRLIAVMGPSAVTSEYVRAEWEHALLFCKVVLPILRLGHYKLLPAELAKFHCPDFRPERPYPEALLELVRILRKPVSSLGVFRTEVPALPPHFLAPIPGTVYVIRSASVPC
jgi:hypothetical protein